MPIQERSTAEVQVTSSAEKEMRKSFSEMLGDADMDSFMKSIGNFMTDEEFFEMNETDVFKEMYDDYQNTPSGARKQESANKLFESFSDLMVQKRNFSPKDLKNLFKGDERLAEVRKALNLEEADDEESKVTMAETIVDSVAQESTISDVSAYQRGVKLAALGANPLGVSVSSNVFFSDDGDDDSVQGEILAGDSSFRQRRALALNESRSKLNYIPETPRNRARRGPSASGDADSMDINRSSVRSSKIMMTPMKESRSSSRSRSRTPSRRSRDMSRSPSRPIAASNDLFVASRASAREASMNSRTKSPKNSPDQPRRTMDYYSSSPSRRSPTKTPQQQTRAQSPGRPFNSPTRRARSHSPGHSVSRSPRKEARRKAASKSPISPRKFNRPQPIVKEDLHFSAVRPIRQRQSGNTTLPSSRNKSPGRLDTRPKKQVPMSSAEETSEILSVTDRSVNRNESSNISKVVTDSTKSLPRDKMSSILYVQKRSQDVTSSRDEIRGRERGADEQRHPTRSRSKSITRRRVGIAKGSNAAEQHAKSQSRSRKSDVSVEEFQVGTNEIRPQSPIRALRGGRRHGSVDPGAEAAADRDCAINESESSSSTKNDSQRRSRDNQQTISESKLEALITISKENGAAALPDENVRVNLGRTRRVAARSSDCEKFPSSVRSRVKRPLRDLSGESRFSEGSHGSVSATSESVVSGSGSGSGSETSSEVARSNDLRRSSSRGRSRPEGALRVPTGRGIQRSRSTGPQRRSRSVSARSPSRDRQIEPPHVSESWGRVSEVSRGRHRTPTKTRREPSTPSDMNARGTRSEGLAAMRARKIAPVTPHNISRPSVGMARVKELNSRKTRSSSVPRQLRRTVEERHRPINRYEKGDSRHASFSGTLEGLKKIRKANAVDTDGEESVQTWDPSNLAKLKSKTQTRAPEAAAESKSGGKKQGTGRRRKVDRRAILVSEFPKENSVLQTKEALIP